MVYSYPKAIPNKTIQPVTKFPPALKLKYFFTVFTGTPAQSPALSETNPVHIFTYYFRNIFFSIAPNSRIFSPGVLFFRDV